MKTKFTIKNFRIFDNNGVDIELTPITILTGRNSSGKSSVVKAITLLDSFLKQVKWAKKRGEEMHLADYKIDFTTYPNSLLGGFDKVLHRGNGIPQITFCYTVYSLMLSEDVRVELVFGMDKKDEIKNGYLKEYRVCKLTGEAIYVSSEKEGTWFNLNLIKNQCVEFILSEFLTHNYCSLISAYEDHNISIEDFEEKRKSHIELLGRVNKQRRNDIYKYVRSSFSYEKSILSTCDSLSYNWDADSFFAFSIVEEQLNTKSKKEVRKIIEKLINESQLSIADKNIINQVFDDFYSSNINSIKDYIQKKESEYLEKFFPRKNLFLKSRAPELVSSDRLSILSAEPFEEGFRCVNLIDIILNSPHTTGEKEKENIKQDDDINDNIFDFRKVYKAMMLVNSLYRKDKNEREITNQYKALALFASRFIEEILLPEWTDNITYVSTGRVEMSRLYKLDSSGDFSKLLKDYLEASRQFEIMKNENRGFANNSYVPGLFLNTWIQNLKLGHSVTVERDKEGFGVYIRLHKNEGDEGVILADEGYGITQLVSILLCIETIILSNRGINIHRYYGMSSLDRYDDLSFHYAEHTILIEEPEIHLHPEFQSKLADMFLSASDYNIHFIIETHSEYLIRKSQVLVAYLNCSNEDELRKKNPFNVVYVDSQNKDEIMYKLEYETTGGFNREFGTGFFDEAANLDLVIIQKEQENKKFAF